MPQQAAPASRTEAMVKALMAGQTLEQVGGHWGLSRERVRQIVAKVNVSPTKIAEARRAQISDIIQGVADANPDMPMNSIIESVKEILRERGLGTNYGPDTKHIKEVLGEDECKRRWHAASSVKGLALTNERYWTDEKIFEVMQQAFKAIGKPYLSHVGYDQYIRQFDTKDFPSAVLIMQRFRFWKTACEKAGVPSGVTRRTYTEKWPKEACLESVVKFMREQGPYAAHGASAYEQWALGDKSKPSLQIVRNKWGQWSPARAAAEEIIEKEGWL